MPNPDADTFAIIKLGPHERPPPDCVAWGSWNAIVPHIRDSKAARADALLVAKADAARKDIARIRADSAQLDLEAVRLALDLSLLKNPFWSQKWSSPGNL